MSDLKLTGKITHIGEVQEGTSKAGKEWKKLTFRIDTGAEFNNVAQFEVFGVEKVDKFTQYNKVGQNVEVSFNVDCKEWKEKYYTNLSAWKVWGLEESETAQSESDAKTQEHNEVSEGLPF